MPSQPRRWRASPVVGAPVVSAPIVSAPVVVGGGGGEDDDHLGLGLGLVLWPYPIVIAIYFYFYFLLFLCAIDAEGGCNMYIPRYCNLPVATAARQETKRRRI